MTSSSPFEDTCIPLKPPAVSTIQHMNETKQREEEEVDETSYDFINDINLEDLDITNETKEIDFSGVEANLNAFQEDNIVALALENNVNLANYNKKIEKDLKKAEIASIRDIIENSEDLITLHSDICAADNLLQSMQNILSKFQIHLKQISGEICDLQNKSISMSIDLENQKQTEKILNGYVNELNITSEFERNITHFPVGEHYIQYLLELNSKIQFHQSLNHEWTAYQDVASKLITLQNEASLRIHTFLIEQFNELNIPKINIALKQQQLLLFKYFMTFLDARNDNMEDIKTKRLKRENSYSFSSMISGRSGRSGIFDDDLAQQLRIFYVDIMSKIYIGCFRSYIQTLTKYKETRVADKTDLLAYNVDKIGALFGSKKCIEYLNRVFILGKRINVLIKKEPVIITQMIDNNNNNHKFQYEEIFKSLLKLLTDKIRNEYRFLLQFFNQRFLCNKIFDKVFQQLLEEFDIFRESCYDSIGILLMIRIIEMIQKDLNKKQIKIKCLESFFDKINMSFWPCFTRIFDENVKSIKQCEPTMSDIKYLKKAKLLNTPHFTTIRVASYITTILILNNDQKQQMLIARIEELRIAFQKLLKRFSNKIEDNMNKCIWLINNYSIIIATMNKDINISTTITYKKFNDLLNKLYDQYIEQELKKHFSEWIKFIVCTEKKLSNDDDDAKIDVNMTQIVSIATEFKSNWKEKLKIAMNNIISNFALNVDATITQQIGQDELFRNQKEIKKKFLQQLLFYHSRFKHVVNITVLSQGRNIQIEALMVPINTMKYHVKALWEV